MSRQPLHTPFAGGRLAAPKSGAGNGLARCRAARPVAFPAPVCYSA